MESLPPSTISPETATTSTMLEPLPLEPSEKRSAAVVFVLLLGALFALTPFANEAWPVMPGYMTAFGAAMLVANLLLASLLFSRGATEGRAATVQLGSAYFFVGVIFVPMMASFPGGLAGGPLIGGPATPVWLWTIWHVGFGLAILRYVQTLRKPGSGTPSVRGEMAAGLAVVGAATWLTTAGQDWLPPLLSNGQTFFSGGQQIIPYGILLLDLLALIALARLPRLEPEQVWLGIGMLAACFDVWMIFRGTDRYSLGWYVGKLGSLGTTLAVLISLFHDLTALYRRMSRANALLADLAHQDGLTGLANRRRFDAVLQAEWARADRAGTPLTLIMLDVDFFKRFNDRYGHAAGDECLKRVAALMRGCARRPGDLAARYGGEEFALVLPATDGPGALALARLLQRELAGLALPHAEAPCGRVSVSIGVAPCHEGHRSPQDLLRAADIALYRAKSGGRDQICIDEEADTAPGVLMEAAELAAARALLPGAA